MSTPRSTLRDLALTLHDLSVRVARFAPHRAGVDPLPSSELLVLRTIQENPGSSVTEVAAAAAMQPSNVSAALRALSGRGLVDKRPHPQDGRISQLYPSKLATENKNAIEEAITATVSSGLRELPAAHRDALIAALPALRELTAAVAHAPQQRSTRGSAAG